MNKSFSKYLSLIAMSVLTGCVKMTYSDSCTEQTELTEVDTDLLTPQDTSDFNSDKYNALCGKENPPLFENRYSPYMGGSESVDIVVEHFSNFRCIHCANFAIYTKELWNNNKEINKRVRIYFHHLPYNDDYPFHAASVAAAGQGMDNFWEMHDYAFNNTGVNLTYQHLYDFAQKDLGLDMTRFENETTKTTSEGDAVYNFLQREHDQAVNACLQYTPSVYVCGNKLENWHDLEDVLMSYFN